MTLTFYLFLKGIFLLSVSQLVTSYEIVNQTKYKKLVGAVSYRALALLSTPSKYVCIQTIFKCILKYIFR